MQSDFIQADFESIFQKQDSWFEEMMYHYNQINICEQDLNQSELMTDEEYKTKWNKWNESYHWWLIRMDQYLCGYNDPLHNMIHEINQSCFIIGHRTGYWNNKHSRRLYNWFQNHLREGNQ